MWFQKEKSLLVQSHLPGPIAMAASSSRSTGTICQACETRDTLQPLPDTKTKFECTKCSTITSLLCHACGDGTLQLVPRATTKYRCQSCSALAGLCSLKEECPSLKLLQQQARGAEREVPDLPFMATLEKGTPGKEDGGLYREPALRIGSSAAKCIECKKAERGR